MKCRSPLTSWPLFAASAAALATLAACSGSDGSGSGAPEGPAAPSGAGAGGPGSGSVGPGSSGSGASGGSGASSGTGAGGAEPGTWQHGATRSIHGSGFGTRPTFGPAGSPSLARAWDDCTSDDPLVTWDEVSPGATSPYGMRCRTPDEVTSLKNDGAAPSPPHARATRYLSSGLWTPTSPDADTWGSSLTVHDTEVSPYFYASFYMRADPHWHATADSDGNFKMYSYCIGNGPYQEAGFYYFGFAGFADPSGGIALGPNYFTGPTLFSACTAPGGDIRCVDPDLVTWYTPGCGGTGDADPCGTISAKIYGPTHPRSGWIKIEYAFKHGDSVDGVHDIWLDNVHAWHVELNDDAVGTQPATRSETLGGYRRDYGTDDGYKNNFSYYSDVYVDLTWARVVLADAAAYAQSTIVEVQPPLAWSDSQIDVQVNLGRLASGGVAYVYVFDATGAIVGGEPVGSFTVP